MDELRDAVSGSRSMASPGALPRRFETARGLTARSLAIMVSVFSLGACASGEAREAPSDAARGPSTGVVDSILPLDAALQRFRAGLTPVASLAGGAQSRDALVHRFVRALRNEDTTALRNMVLSRAEYAWLYYPTSTFAREPFYQMPQLNWFLTVEASEKGISRAVDRYGGRDLSVAAYSCPDTAEEDGDLRFWHGCTVAFTHEGSSRRMRLFGSIAERGGHYKFYSYANDL